MQRNEVLSPNKKLLLVPPVAVKDYANVSYDVLRLNLVRLRWSESKCCLRGHRYGSQASRRNVSATVHNNLFRKTSHMRREPGHASKVLPDFAQVFHLHQRQVAACSLDYCETPLEQFVGLV